jgi:hypothetical protein
MMPTARPFPQPAVIAPTALAAAVAHPTSAAVQAVAIELVSALERSRRSPRLRTEQLIDGSALCSRGLGGSRSRGDGRGGGVRALRKAGESPGAR